VKKALVISFGILFLVICATSDGLAKAKKPWKVPGDFATIQAAIDSVKVVDGDVIQVGPGYFAGATITKAVEIKGIGGATINDGPFPWPGQRPFKAGFYFTGISGAGSGATITNLKFEVIEFPVFSRGANDITVTQCYMLNPIQGITNWSGSRWQINHNEIVDLQCYNGGGIGILVADRSATKGGVNGNVVSHNKISGILHVTGGGGYSGTGIVVYADFRWGYPGALEMAFNQVTKNTISLESDTPDVVDVVAFELTDTRDAAMSLPPAIHDNSIGFNDFRGTANQIAITPEDLALYNSISRNLGENRGHGLHPSLFR